MNKIQSFQTYTFEPTTVILALYGLFFVTHEGKSTENMKKSRKKAEFHDSGNVSFTNFNLSEKDMEMLVKNGKDGTAEYFKWFENPEKKVLNRV